LDYGIDATPNYPIGDIKPQMPNLQKLIDSGLTFDNVWANPVCSPTRATILSGKYGYHTDVLKPGDPLTFSADEQSLHAYLETNNTNNYTSGFFGKWHLSNNFNNISQAGIDHFEGILGGGVRDYFDWNLNQNGVSSNNTDYVTTVLTDLALDWIEDQDQPWFCWLAYNAPHTPLHVPPSEMHSQGELIDNETEIENNPLPYFMAMIESLDFEIGKITTTLSEEELANTIIIFIGDNGTPRNVLQAPYDQNQGKGSLFQGGVKVPMVISGKGVVRKGERESTLINSVDLFATIAELAGSDLNNYENGQSFKNALASNSFVEREYVYAEVLNDATARSGYTIRNEQFKLIEFDNGVSELYDLINDPFEQRNLMQNALGNQALDALDKLKLEANEIRN